MTSLIILGIIAAICYAFLTIKKRKLRNQLRVYDCIFVSEHYSIYSKQLDGGRQFVIQYVGTYSGACCNCTKYKFF